MKPVVFGIGISLRGREPERVEACLASLEAQSYPAAQIVLAEEGENAQVRRLCERYRAEYISVPHQPGPFNKSFVSNVTIRALRPEVDQFAQCDVDVVADPELLRRLADILQRTGRDQVISVRPRRLPPVRCLGTPFSELVAVARDWGDHSAWGMFLTHSKEKVVQLRGFKEAMAGWGWEDTDYVMRARNAGMVVRMADLGPMVLHQWHRPADRSHVQRNRSLAGKDNDNGDEWGMLSARSRGGAARPETVAQDHPR
ncbi:MAG: galactosyltransferase-related protein [Nannocystaceae bacterium]